MVGVQLHDAAKLNALNSVPVPRTSGHYLALLRGINVGGRNAATFASKIERALSARFAYTSRVVVLTQAQLAQIVEGAPAGSGERPEKYKYDVILLREPLAATEAMKSVSLKVGVDTAYKGKGVLYFSRLVSKLTQSHLPRIVTLPVYQHMTIRKWNTTTRLLALMERTRSPRNA
jgi:uncharacterized protein (DUF1697 family)